MGYSALRAGVAFLPLALAITAGTHLAGKLLAKTSPRNIAAGGLAARRGRRRPAVDWSVPDARFATDLLPGLLVLGFGVGMVFVAVAVTAMAGIPAQHAGHGVRVPDDRARGRRRPRRRGPVRGRDQPPAASPTQPGSSTGSPPRSSPPPSSPSASVSWPTCGCPPPGWTAPPRCTCTTSQTRTGAVTGSPGDGGQRAAQNRPFKSGRMAGPRCLLEPYRRSNRRLRWQR